jgi:preprotein translocase subunit SecE
VSNDRDGVTDDGQEPVVGSPSDEAADGSDAVVGDRQKQARTAPPSGAADDVTPESGGDTDSDAGSDLGSDLTADSGATPAGSSPVTAGSARAAARRSAARAGVSDTKGTATPKRATATAVKRPNAFARLSRFLREVVAELRKVIWPTKNQMVTYTIVVIAFLVFMVALVGVLDLLFAKGVLAVFG